MVRNGGRLSSPSLGKFCGSHNVAPITSTWDTISVLFHSDEFGSAPGFRISTSERQRGCGGTIHASRGNITSPNYPARYENNVECVWTIEYNAGNLIRLDFIGRFDIEMDSSCSKDYLQLEEAGPGNRWLPGEKKCGSTPPSPFVSKSNKMRLTFRSNSRIQGEGFSVQFRSECGGNFTDLTGMIISPNYPNLYPDGLNCTYVIGKRGDYISLSFDNLFSIESHDSCHFDYLEIFQGAVNDVNSQGKYCSDTPPATRMLLGPVIVRFVSDYVYAAHGFKLNYNIMDCGGVYTDASGVIGTPSALADYIYGMRCEWHIVAPENYVIQLRFTHFDVQESYQCMSDHVNLYDGNSTSSRPIAMLCGKDPTPSVKSTGRELTLRFDKYRSQRGLGFSAYYYVTFGEAQQCGGTLNSTSGTINFNTPDGTRTSFIPEILDCVWHILVNEPDQVVNLTFESFTMRGLQNGSCTDDFLELREYSLDGPVLGTYCGNRLPGHQTTTATAIKVHFRSQNFIQGPSVGFKLRYAVAPSPCGPSTIIATPELQTVTSPGYPNPYPVNTKCRWTLRFNTTYSYASLPIALSITYISIPCGGDYLEIARNDASYFESRSPLRACGDKPPKLLQGKGVVHITFNSDAADNGGKGFSLDFRTASCNTTYSDDNGVVTSQNYPSRMNFNWKCNFNITAPEGRTVALYFTRFEMFYTRADNCSTNYLKVHEGLGESSPVIGSFCGRLLPNPVFSTGRSLFIEVSMLPFRQGLYFLTYTTTDKGRGCGGRLSSSMGSFSSPLYPRPYSVPGECVWHISVPGYHSVRIAFTSFALANSTADHCDANYLELYEGPDVQQDKRIARFCGTDIPGDHELLSNEATVKLVTDSSNDQSGFLARFESSPHVAVDVPMRVAQKLNTK